MTTETQRRPRKCETCLLCLAKEPEGWIICGEINGRTTEHAEDCRHYNPDPFVETEKETR